MATVKYCDVCGRKTNSYVCIMGLGGHLKYKDFCLNCWKKVEEFLKSSRKP